MKQRDRVESTELELAESRREVAARLADLKQVVRSELGWAPRAAAWMAPALAAVAGVGLALLLRRRVRDRRPPRRLRG